MVDARMRPRFEIEVPLDVQQVRERLRVALDRSDCPHEGHFYPFHVEVRFARCDRRVWSPELFMVVAETQGGTRLRGRFGPRHNLWALFVAMYATLVFTGLVGLVLGVSQATLSLSAWGLWLMPGSLVLIAGVYLAAMVGRGLGREQMTELRALVEQAVGPTAVEADSAGGQLPVLSSARH